MQCYLRSRALEEWNRPSCENGEHNCKRGEVRGMDKQTPSLRLPEDSENYPVEKYEVKRAFGQQGQSEENRCWQPDEPRRFFLRRKAQPKNNRETGKRHVEPFDFDQSAFFYYTDIRQPNERGNCRSARAEADARDRNKCDCDPHHGTR